MHKHVHEDWLMLHILNTQRRHEALCVLFVMISHMDERLMYGQADSGQGGLVMISNGQAGCGQRGLVVKGDGQADSGQRDLVVMGDGQADSGQRGLVVMGDGQADSGQRGLVVVGDGQANSGQRGLVIIGDGQANSGHKMTIKIDVYELNTRICDLSRYGTRFDPSDRQAVTMRPQTLDMLKGLYSCSSCQLESVQDCFVDVQRHMVLMLILRRIIVVHRSGVHGLPDPNALRSSQTVKPCSSFGRRAGIFACVTATAKISRSY